MFTDIPEDVAKDPWFKIVDMLQHNWAVILETCEARVIFYGDTRGVFDEITFTSAEEARKALRRNGFEKYRDDPAAAEFISMPEGVFHEQEHPNGPIYSSGRFWK